MVKSTPETTVHYQLKIVYEGVKMPVGEKGVSFGVGNVNQYEKPH